MKVPLSWLGDFVAQLPAVEALAERLTLAGLEVEEIHRAPAQLLEHLMVARLVEVGKHPNADRLSLCTVDYGAGQVSIVCGASNMSTGDSVVLARPGAVLPDGSKIKKAKIRGIESRGMLCSASELGVYEDPSGILILSDAPAPGTPAGEVLGISEPVLEIGITPNRGDCLSMRGIAREVIALFDLEPSEAMRERSEMPAAGSIPVRIESRDGCPMYRGLEIEGLRVGPCPAWVAGRLAAAGLRPISNVVDVTNYVLLEYGQPLHAFDRDRLQGPAVFVRRLDAAATIETLDSQQRELTAGDLVIDDEHSSVAIAGVMGGLRTAVDEATTNVFLESAMFDPASVRRTSRRLGLVSESSYRFERGVDPDGVEQALLRAGKLLTQLGGGVVTASSTAGEGPRERQSIKLRPPRVSRLLGAEVDGRECDGILQRLGALVDGDEGELSVRPPSWRHDLTREVDLIEEVARVRGYETIEARAPSIVLTATEPSRLEELRRDFRQCLAALGLCETVTLAFASSETNDLYPGLDDASGNPVAVANPLRSDASQLRRSLLPGLLDAAAYNWRNGARVIDLFAIGRTFSSAGEQESAAGVLFGPRRARGPGDAGPVSFFDGKGVVETILSCVGLRSDLPWRSCCDARGWHPAMTASAELAGQELLRVGMIHPDVAERWGMPAEVCLFELAIAPFVALTTRQVRFRRIDRFPAASRDVSLIVPSGILAGDVVGAVVGLAETRIEDVRVFDEYRGPGVPEGQRALSFSIQYRASDHTLTDAEIAELHEGVVAHLTQRLGVQRRA